MTSDEERARLHAALADEQKAHEATQAQVAALRNSLDTHAKDDAERSSALGRAQDDLREAQERLRKTKGQLSSSILARDKFQREAQDMSKECATLKSTLEANEKRSARGKRLTASPRRRSKPRTPRWNLASIL